MRVLLIQPPYNLYRLEPKTSCPPLGLAYIAASLRQNGIEAAILDAVAEGFDCEWPIPGTNEYLMYGLRYDEIKYRIKNFSPDIVGVSCLFTTLSDSAHNICRIAKEVNSNVVTIMGGAHPSVTPEKTLQDPNVDLVCIGEGDETMKDVAMAIAKGNDFRAIDGIGYKNCGDIRINPKTKFINDMDMLPFPARDLLPMNLYFNINTPMGNVARRHPSTPIVTSRGCPARCIFCSIHTVWGRAFRGHSSERVLSEIEHVVEQYGVKEIQFCDDNITFNKDRARRIFKGMIERRFDLLWTTPNGVALWCLDEEIIDLMKASGCWKLSVAVESGDENVLRHVVRKPINLKRIKPLIDYIKHAGLDTDVFFVVGLPGETKENIKRTLDFGLSLRVDNLSLSIATPHPGTELYRICQENHYIPDNLNPRDIRGRRVNIVTEEFDPYWLEHQVAVASFKHRLYLLLHRPRVFYERVVKRLFKDPKFFFSITKYYCSKVFSHSKTNSANKC